MKQRIKEYLKYKDEKIIDFSAKIGVSNAYVSSIRKSIQPDKLARIQQVYPDLNIEWLVTGRGNMLNTPQQAMSVTNYGTNSGTMGNNVSVVNNNRQDKDVEKMSVEELPIIPSNIVNEPKIDVLKYITTNDTDTAPVVHQFPEALAYYKIKSKAMEDKICAGDTLAIIPYPKGEEFIIPGDPYVVDTNTNGLITRRLFMHPDGYRAVSNNPDEYPEFIIPFKHVIRVYRIVGLLRQNVI